MNDESLIQALRALDRPVDVDTAFDDALFAILDREYARRRQPRPGLTLLLVAALLVALLVGGAVAVGSGILRLPVPDSPIIGPDQVDTSDCRLPPAPATTRITEISIDGPVGSIAFAACSVWVASGPPGVVLRIDPVTNEVTATISVGSPDSFVPDIAADGDDVWATVWMDDGHWKLVQIDPASDSVAREIELPPTIGDHLIVTGGRAWLSGFSFPQPGVLDLETGEVIAQIDAGTRFFDAFGSVWANHPQTGAGVMLRIDTHTFEVTTTQLPSSEAYLTAASDTGLWATDGWRVYKLAHDGEILVSTTMAVREGGAVRAALGGYAYATAGMFGSGGPRTHHLVRIDAGTGEIVEELDYPLDGWTEELFVAAGSIWAGSSELPGLVRYEPNAQE